MKKYVLGILLISLFLTSCTKSEPIPSSDDSSDDIPVEVVIPGKVYDDSPGFKKVNGDYIAEGDNSFMFFDDTDGDKSIDVRIDSYQEGTMAAVIIDYNGVDDNYYSIGISRNKKVELLRFDGTTFNEIRTLSTSEITGEFAISVSLYKEYGFINININGGADIFQNMKLRDNTKIGFYSETKDVVFSEVKMESNIYEKDNLASSYYLAYGNMTMSDGVITVGQANSLFVNKNREMSNGVFEFTYKFEGNNISFGCVFALDDKGETEYWRNKGVSYYYLAIGITGSLSIYKCEEGSLISEKYFVPYMYDDSVEHTLKIVKFDNTIDIFLDGQYQYTFEDAEVLKGKKVGFCSCYKSGYYKNIKITPIKTRNTKTLGNVDVVSGEFKSTFSTIRASKDKSLAIVKTPMTSSDGTIRTTIGSTTKFGQGVVFKLSKPNASTYYEKENGLSYYWFGSDTTTQQYFRLEKWVNGTKTQLTKLKYVALSIEHGGDIKIVMEGNYIYCYYANRLIVKYKDNSPLTGRYYGFKTDSAGGSFTGGLQYEEEHNVDKSKYLIFGHSYTHLWLDYKKDFAELGADDVFDIGIGGASTWHYSGTKFDTVGGYIDEVAAYESEWGIYWNGINDINSDQELSTMSVALETALIGMKEKNPKFKCVVIGINRCTYTTSMQRIPQITAANAEYKRICDKYDYLTFVDVETLYCDESGNPQSSYFIDNLHPTKAAYKLASELVISAIKNFGD